MLLPNQLLKTPFSLEERVQNLQHVVSQLLVNLTHHNQHSLQLLLVYNVKYTGDVRELLIDGLTLPC